MKINEQQMTYETPEAELVELKMEASIAGPSDCEAFACGGVDVEEVCDDCNRD